MDRGILVVSYNYECGYKFSLQTTHMDMVRKPHLQILRMPLTMVHQSWLLHTYVYLYNTLESYNYGLG